MVQTLEDPAFVDEAWVVPDSKEVALVVPDSWNAVLVDRDSSEAAPDSSGAVPSASAPDLLAAGDPAFDPEEEAFQVGRLDVAYVEHPEDPQEDLPAHPNLQTA